jgi:hypothetical protein
MQSYQTQNFALALTLATCGVPFFTDEGQSHPILNVYSAEILRTKYGNRYKGLDLEKAAGAAHNDGNQGQVTYCFERTETLERILNAYGSQAAQYQGDATDGPTIEAGEFVDMEPEDAARICCQLIHNRKKLINAWKGCTPIIAIPGGSKTEKHGEKSVTVGSMKLMSINPSKETRAKLRL